MSDARWYAATLLIGGLYGLVQVPFADPSRMLIVAALALFSLTAGILLWRGNKVGKLMGIVVMILIAVWGVVTWKYLAQPTLGVMLILIGWISAWLFFRIDLGHAGHG